MIFSFDKHSFSSNKCRGVSHTPWCERKRNDGGEHIPIVRCVPSPMGGRMRYAPTVLRSQRDDAKSTWTNFKPNLFTTQDHFYIVQYPFVHMQKPLELTSIPFCTRAKPPCKRSRTFCTRAKPPCKRSRTFCSRRKTVMQAFKSLLYTAQNRPANVQRPIVSCVKPPCKCSMPYCSRCKTVKPERESIINSHYHYYVNGLLR